MAIRWILMGWLAWSSAHAMAPNQTSAQPTAKDRLMSCDPTIALLAAKEMLTSARSVQEPLGWFTPALILFQNGERDEALFWFYAAQLRTRYQLIFEQGDRPQLLSIMLMTVGGPINNYGFQDPEKLLDTYDRVLAWDRTTPNPWRERAQTPEQRAQVTKVYEGFEQLRVKVRNEGQTLKQQAVQHAQIYAQLSSQHDRCKPGGVDPSQARHARREEQKELEQWIVQQPRIAQAVGRIDRAAVLTSSTGGDGATMPSGYQLAVYGERNRYVDVTVDRAGRTARFTVTCVSSVSFGSRQIGDKCPK